MSLSWGQGHTEVWNMVSQKRGSMIKVTQTGNPMKVENIMTWWLNACVVNWWSLVAELPGTLLKHHIIFALGMNVIIPENSVETNCRKWK
jgi:hypothetical protein